MNARILLKGGPFDGLIVTGKITGLYDLHADIVYSHGDWRGFYRRLTAKNGSQFHTTDGAATFEWQASPPPQTDTETFGMQQ